MHDETDSVLSVAFLNTVRAVVSKLLLYVLDQYRKEICNGCQINHPSQCQHECLEETPDYFYETMRRIEHSIGKIYNTMTEGDEEKIEIVDQALEFWLIE
ncbi:hypothetical protein ABVT39_023791 [Epinephelus coioides]